MSSWRSPRGQRSWSRRRASWRLGVGWYTTARTASTSSAWTTMVGRHVARLRYRRDARPAQSTHMVEATCVSGGMVTFSSGTPTAQHLSTAHNSICGEWGHHEHTGRKRRDRPRPVFGTLRNRERSLDLLKQFKHNFVTECTNELPQGATDPGRATCTSGCNRS